MQKMLMVWKAAERRGVTEGGVQAETHLIEDGGQGSRQQRQISCNVDFCSCYLICYMQICMLYWQEIWGFWTGGHDYKAVWEIGVRRQVRPGHGENLKTNWDSVEESWRRKNDQQEMKQQQ